MHMDGAELPNRKAVDLFSGCGGLSLGLRRAGFEVIAAVDSDPLAVSTYKRNHIGTNLFAGDIRTFEPSALMEKCKLNPGELDLVAGCPPCQGFSRLRTLNGAKEATDPQNELVFQFIRFVKVLRPKAIMMENVPGLMNDDRLDLLRRELRKIQYDTDVSIFDAARYGVPQRRRRMLLVGAVKGVPPFAKESRRRTVSQAIRNLPTPDRSDDPLHNYPVKRAEKVEAMIRQIPKDGGNRMDLAREHQLDCHRRLDGFRDVYGRMAWRKEAPTITGGCINPSKGRFLHPEQNRAITLREAAILQGFPKSYEFDLSRGRYPAAQMIGNAFPPKFAEHHARAIYCYLDESDKQRRGIVQ